MERRPMPLHWWRHKQSRTITEIETDPSRSKCL
jgi:hypothetical protein